MVNLDTNFHGLYQNFRQSFLNLRFTTVLKYDTLSWIASEETNFNVK